MKISFWDVLTGILMFAGFGVVLVFANIFIDPYTILNPFPPPTIQPTIKVPTLTPTLRSLPDIWTPTSTGNAQTVTLLPSLTPVASATGFALPTATITGTNTPIPSLTPVGTNTPTRTNTPYGGKTSTPTRTRTPTANSFAVTSVRNVAVSPSSYSGTCPKNFTFSADIYYTRDGTITYYWVRSSDNAHLGSGSLDLDGTSPDHLTKTISLGSLGYVNTSTYKLYIDNPNHQQFGGVSLPITCTGFGITSNGGGATATISIAENTTAVTTVTSSLGGTTFSITGGSDAGLFSINAASGALTFSSAPDYETAIDSDHNNSYIVNVHAANGSNTDDQLITVNVTNTNDNSPVITSNGGGATAAISLAENVTAVTTVAATDADAGSTITYSKTGGADTSKFNINATTGALTFASAPDFESPTDTGSDNTYEVIVQASDGTNTDTQTITVTITNANEAPTITSNGGGASASIAVDENSTAVTTVTATDPDAGASLSYSIVGGADQGLFNIDGSSGDLEFTAPPDYESPGDADSNNVYLVTVQVSDGSLTDSQNLSVSVNNLNDNNPSITSGNSANVTTGTTAVMTVTATDPDAGTTFSYSITGGADQAFFSINPSSGALSFSSAPDVLSPADAGGDNVYDVDVTVSDGSNTDSISIAVTVIP